MIWVIRAFAMIGVIFFILGFIAREPSPTTYAGEDLAYELMLWVIALLFEVLAGILYLAYRFL